jgi:hypothetical protein
MYMRIKTSDADPMIYFRSGRLVGSLALEIEFLVDTDSSLYP